MRYSITLKINYDYPDGASGGRQLLYLTPADLGAEQQLLSAQLSSIPAAAASSRRFDFFGNTVQAFQYPGLATRMTLHMQALVNRSALLHPQGYMPQVSALAMLIDGSRSLAPDSPHHFDHAQPELPEVPAISAYARAICRPELPVIEALRLFGESLHRDMQFDAQATDVSTPPARAFAQRKGVCQDFSGIMITGLRACGIPAGYVSGYLRTLPPPGQPRLEGADAMHAWVRVWCGPEVGWVEYDPTNAVFANNDHIVVARGRSYQDVAPVSGILQAAGAQSSTQMVDVKPVAE